jgi:predicted transcriptional regulator
VSKHKRSHFQIVYETLAIIIKLGGASKTQLVYRSNSTFRRTEKLLSLLQEHQLIEKRSTGDKIIFVATTKGVKLSQTIENALIEIGYLEDENYPSIPILRPPPEIVNA